MIGPATLKKTFKQTTGWATLLAQPFRESSTQSRASIFYYHRVANLGFHDSRVDDWNVTPKHFEKQIAALATFAEIIPLGELQEGLRSRSPHAKPLVALTFDDGYANFHSFVLPILKRYQAPATAFVVTSAIGSKQPMPFDRWANRNSDRAPAETWRPLNWSELEDCAASGLVTIGGHSHLHLRGSKCTIQQMVDEAGESHRLLLDHLGEAHSSQYAYPYGNTKLRDVSTDYVAAVEAAGYKLAVTTNLGLAKADDDPYTLPRLEAHITDSAGILKAKVHGSIGPLRLTDHIRGVYRA
ncbi:MAG TPA: polysaccharide deacetylase family protein [Pyrinomonadaceae bacterium]|nr:polysaccharide deacetylase family protein [Pyrinomonadaceae bacterium]